MNGPAATRTDFYHAEIQKRDQYGRWKKKRKNAQIGRHQKREDHDGRAGTDDENRKQSLLSRDIFVNEHEPYPGIPKANHVAMEQGRDFRSGFIDAPVYLKLERQLLLTGVTLVEIGGLGR